MARNNHDGDEDLPLVVGRIEPASDGVRRPKKTTHSGRSRRPSATPRPRKTPKPATTPLPGTVPGAMPNLAIPRRLTRTRFVMLAVPLKSVMDGLSREEAQLLSELGSDQILVEDLADIAGRPLKEVVATLNKLVDAGVITSVERRRK